MLPTIFFSILINKHNNSKEKEEVSLERERKLEILEKTEFQFLNKDDDDDK